MFTLTPTVTLALTDYEMLSRTSQEMGARAYEAERQLKAAKEEVAKLQNELEIARGHIQRDQMLGGT